MAVEARVVALPGEAEGEGALAQRRVARLADCLEQVQLVPLRRALDGGALEARALALAWISDRAAVDADVAPAVLDTAARFADAATFAQLERATVESSAQKDRYNLLRAIGKARDPALRERALALSLARQDGEPRINGRDTIDLLVFTMDDDASRKAAFDYVRANFDPLLAKVPLDSTGSASLVSLFPKMGQMCTRAEREAFVGFIGPRAPQFTGGEFAYRQALETIDLCLAAHERPNRQAAK